ncbi:MAG: methionyl-tRNA formyltransferase [SAR202 cluster bacterium]|nr:methionyl-tRNA formyltransferase [SAR202 cluster bacterium]
MTSNISQSKIRILFMGTGVYGSLVFNELDTNFFDIIGVVTKSQNRISRNPNLNNELNIQSNKNFDIYRINKFTDEMNLKLIQLNPSIIIVASFGLILPDYILQIPTLGVINIHPSLLPKLRGPSPISSAIIEGMERTGVSIIKMVKELDAGPILFQEEFEIDENYNAEQLGLALFNVAAKNLNQTVKKIVDKSITGISQDHSLATYTKMVKKDDGLINWTESGELIIRKLKAYSVWPGVYTHWNNKRLIIKEAEFQKKENTGFQKNGQIIGLNNHCITVKTLDGFIHIKSLQLEGSKIMDATSFVHGRPAFINSNLN